MENPLQQLDIMLQSQTKEIDIEIYVLRNTEGKYLSGNSWVDNIKAANVYTWIGTAINQAMSMVDDQPELVKLRVSGFQEIKGVIEEEAEKRIQERQKQEEIMKQRREEHVKTHRRQVKKAKENYEYSKRHYENALKASKRYLSKRLASEGDIK